MSPQRIQRSRAKGWRMPEGAVYVGRPTKWGNPFEIRWSNALGFWQIGTRTTTSDGWRWQTWAQRASARGAREAAVEAFALHIGPMGNYEYGDEQIVQLRALRGRDLACWCPLDQPCHADVLLELANEEPS